MAFKWFRPARHIPPAPRPVLPTPPCWVLGCTEVEAWARVGLTVLGLPSDAEVCETHDLALEFNMKYPAAAGLDDQARTVHGDADHGWLVGGFLLVRPPAPVKASPEPGSQRSDLP